MQRTIVLAVAVLALCAGCPDPREGIIKSETRYNLAEVAYEKGDLMLVVDASNQKLRIAGPFQSKW